MRGRKKVEFIFAAVCVICTWYLIFTLFLGDTGEGRGHRSDWRYEADEQKDEEHTPDPAPPIPDVIPDPPKKVDSQEPSQPSLPDRVVVMAKLPEDDTSWVEADLQDWQSAIYDIDANIFHDDSIFDPLNNSTTRILRNKGMEANAYLAYIVQNYHQLPSTIAFVHPHKDGYPLAWHTDNAEHSNVLSLRALNTDFIQRNGYANLRCIPDPGCPHEVMPFRDPPEEHRTIEAAMPSAWQELFGNTDVPHILATPCCAQFAISSKQVHMRPLEDYQKYYKWLMDTPLKDETSGRVFEYLWHIIFGQDPV